MSRSPRLTVIILALAILPAACGPTPMPASGVATLGPIVQAPATFAATQQYRPSPAGWIAFARDGDIWLVHPDGSTPKQITQHGGGSIRMAWSSDGTLLAYSQDGVLSVMDAASLASSVLVEHTGGSFDWSATAHQIVYDTAVTDGKNDGLWVVDAGNGKTRQLKEASPDDPALTVPHWSFDSNRVIFETPGGDKPPAEHLLDGGSGVISDLPGYDCSWSPLELLIACLAAPAEGASAPGVLILNENGIESDRIALPEGDDYMHLGPWSSDGGSIAISYSPGQNGSGSMTGILSLDEREFKPLGSGRALGWSPDGRWLVADGGPAPASLTVINAATGQSAPLVDGSAAAWQPAPIVDWTLTPGPTPEGQGFCMNTAVGFVHQKPKGHFLIFCIGSQKYNYGALASGVYLVGPKTQYFIYVSNTGFVYAARMGDPALTRIGNVRDFRAVRMGEYIDPNFEIRLLPAYPYLVQVIEKRFNQKATFTLPRRIIAP